MNKKVLSLSIAVLAISALFAGNQTIKSINAETSGTTPSNVNEAVNITTVESDSSAILPSEANEIVKPVAVANEPSAVSAENEVQEKKLTVAEAEAIALNKAGFSASEVYDKEVELDYEKGVQVYEVSFEKDRVDYEYVIDAASGEVLHSKSEPEDDGNVKPSDNTDAKKEKAATEAKPNSPAPAEAPEEKISAKEAESIALNKAGFSASEIHEKEVELDYEKGVQVYEVSFEKGNKDYEYVIDAVSGDILHSKIDIDD